MHFFTLIAIVIVVSLRSSSGIRIHHQDAAAGGTDAAAAIGIARSNDTRQEFDVNMVGERAGQQNQRVYFLYFVEVGR